MIIRPLEQADLIQLKTVHLAAMHNTPSGYYTAQENQARLARIIAQTYDARIEQETYLVAVNNVGELLGFAAWHASKLGSLFVHPERQRQGIGSSLLNACLQAAGQSGQPITQLHATLNARLFYEEHGFSTVGLSFREWEGVRIPRVDMIRNA